MKTKDRGTVMLIIALLLLPLLLTALPGCAADERKHSRTLFAMDTHVDITLYHHSAQIAQTTIGEISAEIERLENILNRHMPGSDLQRINAAAGKEPVQVSRETVFVLERALEFAALSGGAFDPTIAPLLELWGFGGGGVPVVPAPEALARVRQLVDYRAVVLDKAKGTVFLPQAGMKLDLGGIAKGYIVDRAQELARQSASASFVNAGGDISISGRKPTGDDWRIAVRDPHDPRRWLAIINMEGGSVTTSGDYERYFEAEGVRYHHILDPHTGMPAFGLSSVTIVAGDTLTADALATAVFVLGKEKGMALVERLPAVEAILVNSDGNMLVSSGLAGQVEILGE